MKLVCLDTCTKSLSIAAMEDGNLLSSRWHNANVNHSVLLMPMLSEMLETLGWDAKDVDVWAAVAGPGSFTGVRIGVSSTRALAHGWQKPAVSVNTLEALAMQCPVENTLIEWPERLEDYIPTPRVEVYIDRIDEDKRSICIQEIV